MEPAAKQATQNLRWDQAQFEEGEWLLLLLC
jgi:hypothetical protein